MKKIISIILGLVLVSDSFTQWTQISSAPTDFILNIGDIDGTLYISHSFRGVFKSTDSAVTWQQVNNGLNNDASKTVYEIISFEGNLYAATFEGIYKSTNAGNEWIKKSNGIVIDPGQQYVYTVSIFEHNGNLFTGAYNGIYISADNAENWSITSATGEHVSAKNFIEHNGILFAARESGNQPRGFKSTDNGLSWGEITGLTIPTISFYSEHSKLWAGTVHAVWLSTDNGESWEVRENGLPPDPYNTWVIRVNGVLLSSLLNSAVYTSTNEGITWEDYSHGFPFSIGIGKLIIYNDKIIAISNQGLWQRDTSEVITVMRDDISLPQEFELFQNYPNPFNPATKVSYSILELSFITIKVYDVLGNEIATLVDEYKPAGNYEVEFNIAQISRPEISSGVYLYQLRDQNFIETKKMVLMK